MKRNKSILHLLKKIIQVQKKLIGERKIKRTISDKIFTEKVMILAKINIS